MIYKHTSVKRVIAKVFTDLDLKEGDHRISDLIEWTSEALEKIGAFPSFVNKVTGKAGAPILELSNYQVQLPCDFHRPIQLAYSTISGGPFYPMRSSTGSFDIGGETNEATSSDYTASESALVALCMEIYDLDYEAALAKINDEPATRSLLNSLLEPSATQRTADGTGGTDFTVDYTYRITSNYIKTNVETGYLMLAYQAIPTDGEGYPLIPDDQSFIEAIYWYINMKLMYPKWMSGQIRDAVYYDARRSWNYYCKQAYGNALMPDPDQMESIKNSWLRLVPDIDAHDTFFSTLGERELIHKVT